MPRIFICYRRNDTALDADKLYNSLTARFGNGNTYMDVYSNPYGEYFKEIIVKKITRSNVMLVIIGKNWLAEFATHQNDDNVLFEIQLGLASELLVIPVLIDTDMPSIRNLPEGIVDLKSLHALKLRSANLNEDIEQLIRRIEEASATEPTQADSPPLLPDDEHPTKPNQLSSIHDSRPDQQSAVAAILVGLVLIALVVLIAMMILSQSSEFRIPQQSTDTAGTAVKGIGSGEFTSTPSATASSTATYTNTATFTVSPTPTLTPTSTATLTPTATNTTAPCLVSTTANADVKVHVGAASGRSVVRGLAINQSYPVIGYHRNETGEIWYLIVYLTLSTQEPNRQWINSANAGLILAGDCQLDQHILMRPNSPIIPLPTSTSTPQPVPTATQAYQPPPPDKDSPPPVPTSRPAPSPTPTTCWILIFPDWDCDGTPY